MNAKCVRWQCSCPWWKTKFLGKKEARNFTELRDSELFYFCGLSQKNTNRNAYSLYQLSNFNLKNVMMLEWYLLSCVLMSCNAILAHVLHRQLSVICGIYEKPLGHINALLNPNKSNYLTWGVTCDSAKVVLSGMCLRTWYEIWCSQGAFQWISCLFGERNTTRTIKEK